MRLPWRKPAPAPATITTHIEHDLSELNTTPPMIEPNAYCRAIALDNAGLFTAYLSVGFDREEAFELLQQQLEAVLFRGQR